MTGARQKAVRVRARKGRSASSQRWLMRQLNDPYVAAAKRSGYRARSAYKLIELIDRFKFLKPGMAVLDLGAAPGGWAQVATDRVGEKGRVVGIDLLAMDPIPGAVLIQGDFLDPASPRKLTEALGRPADLVLSDMAANATGHRATDHIRIMSLLEAAVAFAAGALKPGGAFVGKVFQGGTEKDLLAVLKREFASVRHAKPPASRK